MASGANNSYELGATGSSDPHNSNNQSPTGDLGDEQQFAKRKRACKSKVWVDMIKIDNETRAQCIHCKGCYVISATGTTTTLHRHVSNSTEKKKADRQQQLLNFQRVFDEDKGTSSSFPVLDLYDANEILQKTLELKKILREIHAEYARLLRVRPASSTIDSTSSSQGGSSNLDVYLEEGIYLCKDNSAISFNILDWWKSHETKFPILSKMAAHFLAISITTVASEATFSVDGHVIDTYRASLDPEKQYKH
nr:zinc finger BED domain-containing protein RICESLEEPER 2-like [Tanacetum cinerariifolium]